MVSFVFFTSIPFFAFLLSRQELANGIQSLQGQLESTYDALVEKSQSNA